MQQKQKIRACYQDHWLFSHLYPTAKEMERKLNTLRLSPEELFVECLTQIDLYLKNPEAYLSVCRSLYDDYYCELRERGNHTTEKKEIEMASMEVCIVLSYLFCLMEEEILANAVFRYISDTLIIHEETYKEHCHSFITKLWEDETKHNRFIGRLKNYINTKQHLSATIENQLEEWSGGDSAAQVNEGYEKSGDLYPIWQLVVLFQELLNISTEASFINVSDFATFIHKVTGRKKDSIRVIINSLNKSKEPPDKGIMELVREVRKFNEAKADEILRRFQ